MLISSPLIDTPGRNTGPRCTRRSGVAAADIVDDLCKTRRAVYRFTVNSQIGGATICLLGGKLDVSRSSGCPGRNKNVLELIAAGGNIYYLAKFAGIYKLNVQDVGAQQTGMTVDEFKEKLRKAGD